MILAHLAAKVSDWAVVVAGVKVLLAVGKQTERQEQINKNNPPASPVACLPHITRISLCSAGR